MGFDLQMIRTPEEMSKKVPFMVREYPGYFRGVPDDTMNAASIIDNGAKKPKFPAWPPAGLKDKRAEQLQLYFEAGIFLSLGKPAPKYLPLSKLNLLVGELRIMQDYLDAHTRALSTRSEFDGMIPWFKFSSNNGWIVVPEECLNIALGLTSWLLEGNKPQDREPVDFVKAFVVFNEIAAQHWGYEVC